MQQVSIPRRNLLLSISATGILATTGPASADTKGFRIGMTTLPGSKGNPYFSTATSPNYFWTSIYDTLTLVDEQGGVVPWLALSWDMIEDTVWLLKLRPDVTFSNGEPFDAFAVKTVIDSLTSDVANATQSVARELRFLAGASVIDPLIIELRTKWPMAVLPQHLVGMHIAAPRHLNRVGFDGLQKEPIGSGPFVVDTWTAEKISLKANTSSWRTPRVDTLEVLAIPDPTSRIQALETDRVDIAMALSTDHIDRLKAGGNRYHLRNPIRTSCMAFITHNRDTPFDDVRVRQAINYAVNRWAITRTLLDGLVEPSGQPAPKGVIGYDPSLEPYPYDPGRAKTLLTDAGYPNGFDFILELVQGTTPNDAAIAQQIAQDLAKVGVNMQLRTILFPQLLRNMLQGGFKGDAFMVDYSTSQTLDGMRYYRLHSCNNHAAWFCDESIQPLIEEAKRTADLEMRIQLTQQLDKYYRDQAQTLLLYPIMGLDGVGPRVTHWKPMNDNLMWHTVDV